jgi:signal transduction histidine kinase
MEYVLEQRDSRAELQGLRGDQHLERHWQELVADGQAGQFAAIVGPAGQIVAHSNPQLVGRRLERGWYEGIVDMDGGLDVYEAASAALSDGRKVYSVRVPILVDNQEVGEYHTGFSAAWFDARLTEQRGAVLRRWALLFVGIFLVVVLAAISLYSIAMHSLGFGRALGLLKLQRATEMEQFAGGLAHEIRNPLHAIRLNLHTLARALAGTGKMDPKNLETVIEQTNQEIQRVDGLVQQMLGFTTAGEVKRVDVDLVEEVRSTLRFLQHDLERHHIELDEHFPRHEVKARVDPDRFRQIMLNLMINAKEELPEGGRLELHVRQRHKFAEVSLSDNGPGIAARDCERIFEPFYSTKQRGLGLGLALVRRFVEDLGGRIWCESDGERGGTTFRLEVPRG